MNEQLRRCAVGLLALGLTSTFGLAAVAQDIDEDGYVIEESYTADEPTMDEPDASVAVIDDDADTVVIASRNGMRRCADTFRSFDPDTGTYVTYQGETRTCPYIE